MNKSIIRIVSALLVPCLLMDPAAAAGVLSGRPASPPPFRSTNPVFDQQAINAALAAGFEHIKSSFNLKDRFQFIGWFIDASGRLQTQGRSTRNPIKQIEPTQRMSSENPSSTESGIFGRL